MSRDTYDHHTPRLSRRHLLALGATGALGSSLPLAAAHARAPRPSFAPRSRPVRNIVFLAGDGMGQGSITLADIMLRVTEAGPSSYQRLIESPRFRRATCMTHSADGWVTDSAAAGSAWGIGEHINNGAVNFTPDERTPEPILVTARSLGKRTGLVTTTRITHATPASFVANVPDRDMEDEIALQILDRRIDLALGGGAMHFPAELLGAHPDLSIARDLDSLNAASQSGRLLGLFADSHCPYEIDRGPTSPSLRQMALAALTRLDRSPDGFVLQIEGGRIDHAAHDNDAAALIADQIEFDATIGAVTQWADGRDDTLIIITSDHVTANPGLTFYAKDGNRSFNRLRKARHSSEWINERYAQSDKGLTSFVAITQEATGITLTAEDQLYLGRALIDKLQVDPFNIANGTWMVLGSVLANHTGVAFLSPNHTADHVDVFASGPGSESLPPFIDNIHLHAMMLAALGVPKGG